RPGAVRGRRSSPLRSRRCVGRRTWWGSTGTTRTAATIPQAAGFLIVESEPVHPIVIHGIARDGMDVPAVSGERLLHVVLDQQSRTVHAEVVTRLRAW